MGNDASTIMTKYYKKINTDSAYARDSKAQTKTFTKLFALLDSDGNGVIEGSEIPVLVSKLKSSYEAARNKPLTEDKVQAILKIADQNDDGKIDFDEFCGMMFSVAKMR